jgi:hypothetical protein
VTHIEENKLFFSSSGKLMHSANAFSRSLAAAGVIMVFCATAFWIWVITDYRQVWVHPEYFYQINRHTIPNKHFGLSDLSGFFNCDAIGEQCKRARFVNNLVTGPVIKTRLLLWQVVPPHPTFSPVWILSLASLFLLFRIVVLLTRDRAIAYAIVALYIVSVGFMSHFAQLLHAAKPLVCFFMIASTYCALRLVELGPKAAPRSLWLWWGLLVTNLVGAFLSDEIGWFMWPAIPLIAPSLFIREGRLLWRPILGYLALIPAMVLFLTFIAPVGSWFFFRQHFDFWGWTFNIGRTAVPSELSLLERFTIKAILTGGYNMLYNTTVVPQLGPWATIASWSATAVVLALLAFAPDKWLAIRLLILLCGYIFFQGLVTLRGGNLVGNTSHHTYYYGSSFPIFALLALAALLAGRVGNVAAIAIVPYIFVAHIGNFVLHNHPGPVPLEVQSYPPDIVARYKGVGYNKPLTFTKTLELWRAVRAGEPPERDAARASTLAGGPLAVSSTTI